MLLAYYGILSSYPVSYQKRRNMEVQCENKKCGKSIDVRDEACFCAKCQKYYCETCYDANHAEHDSPDERKTDWALALQR